MAELQQILTDALHVSGFLGKCIAVYGSILPVSETKAGNYCFILCRWGRLLCFYRLSHRMPWNA